jgi:hypothetical protein
MAHYSLKLATIALLLVATAGCTKPSSGNNHQMDATNATAEPTNDAAVTDGSGNNHSEVDAANSAASANADLASGNNVVKNKD